MRDVVVILMTLGFFALCVVYVALCDRIVGPDEQDGDAAAEPSGASTAVSVDVAEGSGVTP